jgi:hypothetical protein
MDGYVLYVRMHVGCMHAYMQKEQQESQDKRWYEHHCECLCGLQTLDQCDLYGVDYLGGRSRC